jgi:ketosteroid isomerase-like protein
MKKCVCMIVVFIWVGTLIVLFCGCGSENENAQSKAAIDQIRKEFDKSWLSENADVILKHCTDDIILMPPNVKPVIGKEELGAFLKVFFDHFTFTDLKIREREVIASGGLAFERIAYDWVILPEGQDRRISEQINFLGIYQRQADGAWKEVRGIWNSAKPVAGEQ